MNPRIPISIQATITSDNNHALSVSTGSKRMIFTGLVPLSQFGPAVVQEARSNPITNTGVLFLLSALSMMGSHLFYDPISALIAKKAQEILKERADMSLSEFFKSKVRIQGKYELSIAYLLSNISLAAIRGQSSLKAITSIFLPEVPDSKLGCIETFLDDQVVTNIECHYDDRHLLVDPSGKEVSRPLVQESTHGALLTMELCRRLSSELSDFADFYDFTEVFEGTSTSTINLLRQKARAALLPLIDGWHVDGRLFRTSSLPTEIDASWTSNSLHVEFSAPISKVIENVRAVSEKRGEAEYPFRNAKTFSQILEVIALSKDRNDASLSIGGAISEAVLITPDTFLFTTQISREKSPTFADTCSQLFDLRHMCYERIVRSGYYREIVIKDDNMACAMTVLGDPLITRTAPLNDQDFLDFVIGAGVANLQEGSTLAELPIDGKGCIVIDDHRLDIASLSAYIRIAWTLISTSRRVSKARICVSDLKKNN